MRRIKVFISITLITALLAGCGNNNGNTTTTGTKTEATTEAVTETTTEAVTETTTEASTEAATETTISSKVGKSPIWNKKGGEQADAFPKPADEPRSDDEFTISSDMMKYYLDGSWVLIPHGFPIMDPEKKPDILSFDSNKQKMTFSRGSDNQYGEFSFTLDDLFGAFPETNNLLNLTGTYESDSFISSGQSLVGMTDQFQIVIANVRNEDMLMLRPIGNGNSLFADQGMGDNNATQGFWVFGRYSEDDDYVEPKMERINNINDQLKKRNDTFYAIMWFDMGGAVILQHVDPFQTWTTYEGDEERALCYNYENKDYPLSAVEYWLVDGENLIHSGEFSPSFVRVKTNENGDIVRLDYIKYHINGYYICPTEEDFIEPSSQTEPTDPDENNYPGGLSDDGLGWDERDERDPDIFGDEDAVFLGYWDDGDGNSVMVNPADPQKGGFYLYFNFGGTSATAFAYGDEDGGFVIYNGVSSTDGGDFRGYAVADGSVLRFSVSTSSTDLLSEAESFVYYIQ